MIVCERGGVEEELLPLSMHVSGARCDFGPDWLEAARRLAEMVIALVVYVSPVVHPS